MNNSSKASLVSIASDGNGASTPVTIPARLNYGRASIQYLKYQKEQDQPFQCIPCNITFRLLNTFVMHMAQMHNKYITVDHGDQVEKQLLALAHNPSPSLKDVKGIKSSESGCLQTSNEAKSNKRTCNNKVTDVNAFTSTDSGCFQISSGAQSSTPEVLHYMKHQEAQKPTSYCIHCNINFNVLEVFVRHMEQFHKICAVADPDPAENLKKHVETHSNESDSLKLFSCQQCAKQFREKPALDMHITDMHNVVKDAPFSCAYCDHKFMDKSTLHNHVSKLHSLIQDEDTLLSCTQCDKKYRDKTALEKHVAKEHSLMKAPSSASLSYSIVRSVDETLVSTTRDSNENDQKSIQYLKYEKEQDKPFKCIPCNITFRLLRTFVLHMAQMHNKYIPVDQVDSFQKQLLAPAHKPSISSKVAKDKDINNSESKCLQASKEPKFAEQTCNFKATDDNCIKSADSECFAMSSGAQSCTTEALQHIKPSKSQKNFVLADQVHSLQKENSIKSTELDSEENMGHPKDKPVRWSYCLEEFSSNCVFKSHINLRHPLAVECDNCHNMFVADKLHLESHQGVQSRQLQKNNCVKCKNKFMYNEKNLKKDMETHSNETAPLKLFSCSQCVKQFQEKNTLDMHITEVHNLVKDEDAPFSCANCDHKFWDKPTLLQHASKVHNSIKDEDTGTISCSYGDNKFKTSIYKIKAPSSAGLSPTIVRSVDETLINMTRNSNETYSTTATHMENNSIDLVMLEGNKTRTPPPEAIQYLNNKKVQVKFYECIICNTTFRFLKTFVKHMAQMHNKYISVDPVDPLEIQLSHPPSTPLKVAKDQVIKRSASECLKTSYEAKSDEPTCNFKGTDVNNIKSTECFLVSSGAQSFTPDDMNYMKPQKAQMNTFECIICNATFRLLRTLVVHMALMHNKYITVDQMNSLDKNLLALSNRHNTSLIDIKDTGINNTESECAQASSNSNITFRKEPTLDMHGTNMHSINKDEDGLFICTYCDHKFKNEFHWNSHIRAIHAKHVCTTCGKQFSHLRNLYNHIRRMHNAGRCLNSDYELGFKEEKYRNRFGKDFVIRIHEKKQGCFRCLVCGFTFGEEEHLVAHMKSQHSDRNNRSSNAYDNKRSSKKIGCKRQTRMKNYPCDHCGVVLATEIIFARHLCKPALEKYIVNLHSPFKDEDGFSCTYCDNIFLEKHALDMHVTNVHSLIKETSSEHSDIQKEKTKCHICQRSFKTKTSLRMHISFIHPKDKPVKCSLCEKQFWEKSDLNKHFRKMHSDLFSCTYCDCKFKNKYGQKKHISVVHGVTTVALCSICGKLCNGMKNLYQHIRTHHKKGQCLKLDDDDVKEGENNCRFCLRCFRNHVVRRTHEKKHLCEDGHFKCLICLLTFAEKQHLVAHVMCEHSDIINLSSVAYKNYNKKRKYYKKNKKIRSKRPKKQSKCQCHHCGVVLNSEKTLHIHLQNQHPSDETSSFTCNECSKSYQNKHSLQMHIYRRHTPRNYCVCHVCGRQFTCKGVFMKHMLSHTGPKHECGICYKKFHTSNYLKVHQWMHSGVKQFVCPICSKPCAFATGLKYHMKTHLKKS